MPPTYVPFPSYLQEIFENNLTYAHLGNCGEWDVEGGDGSIPVDWRCGPSAAPCDNEDATGEPDCLVGHLVKPPINSWMDFHLQEPKDGIKDIIPPRWCPWDMAGGSGPLSPFWAYYAPGQPDSECWDAVIFMSYMCTDPDELCVTFPGPIECGGVPGTIPSPEPSPPYYTYYDHDDFPGYIRILPVGPLISYEQCIPSPEINPCEE